MTVPIPDSHRDLLERPIHAVLATLMPDGQPQSTLVWVDYDGGCILVNTTLERQKIRNAMANPCVTLLVIDPEKSSRWLEVRGQVVALVRTGAEAHVDQLTRRYGCGEHFYGDVDPVEQRARETRVIAHIAPEKVTCDAIFG